MDIKLIVNNVRVYCTSIKLSTKHSVNNFYIVQVLMKSILYKIDKDATFKFSWSESKLNIAISYSPSCKNTR